MDESAWVAAFAAGAESEELMSSIFRALLSAAPKALQSNLCAVALGKVFDQHGYADHLNRSEPKCKHFQTMLRFIQALDTATEEGPACFTPDHLAALLMQRLQSGAGMCQPCLVYLIRSCGISVDLRCENTGVTCLMLAFKCDFFDTALSMLNRGADVFAVDSKGRNVLHYMAMSDCVFPKHIVEVMCRRLSQLATTEQYLDPLRHLVLVQDADGYTPLHTAVAHTELPVLPSLTDVLHFYSAETFTQAMLMTNAAGQ